MPVSVKCPACGASHKAPDQARGKTLRCLACKSPMSVPAEEVDAAAILLAMDDQQPAEPPEPTPSKFFDPDAERSATPDDAYGVGNEPQPAKKYGAPGSRQKKARPAIDETKRIKMEEQPSWRRHLHWLLVLAMLPLIISLFKEDSGQTVIDRLEESIDQASPEMERKIERLMDRGGDLDDLFELFPGNKLPGAFLSRKSYAHWGMAIAATVLFMVFFMFLASDGSAKPLHVLFVGLFTSTIGVLVLAIIQVVAMFSSGGLFIFNSVLMIFTFVFRLIAFSYSAADDPTNGFFLSFIGFTMGVGLCEELVKTIPLFQHREVNEGKGRAWRGVFIWGLASGAGFGIAEGILYSSRYYNGILGGEIYVIRFLSCVALHAIWSGSVAITLYLRRDLFASIDSWSDWILPLLIVIGIPMVLHGLYDTSLKKDMNGVAVLVALASFGWLAFLSSRLYGNDDQIANRKMLAEYKKRRQVIS